MYTNRSFKLFIVIALVLIVALTVRDVFATTIITPHTDVVIKCNSLSSRYSIDPGYGCQVIEPTHEEQNSP